MHCARKRRPKAVLATAVEPNWAACALPAIDLTLRAASFDVVAASSVPSVGLVASSVLMSAAVPSANTETSQITREEGEAPRVPQQPAKLKIGRPQKTFEDASARVKRARVHTLEKHASLASAGLVGELHVKDPGSLVPAVSSAVVDTVKEHELSHPASKPSPVVAIEKELEALFPPRVVARIKEKRYAAATARTLLLKNGSRELQRGMRKDQNTEIPTMPGNHRIPADKQTYDVRAPTALAEHFNLFQEHTANGNALGCRLSCELLLRVLLSRLLIRRKLHHKANEIPIKVSGDAFECYSSSNLMQLTLSVFQREFAHKSEHRMPIAIWHGSDHHSDFAKMKQMLSPVSSELELLSKNGITLLGRSYRVRFLFTGDYEWLNAVFGRPSPTADNPCLYCAWISHTPWDDKV